MSQREHTTGWALIVAAVLALIYFFKPTSTAVSLMTGTLPADPLTGCPQFDSTNPVSIPGNFAGAIAPLCTSDLNGPTNTPKNAKTCGCPIGYQLQKDVATGAYYCIQIGDAQQDPGALGGA